MSKPKRFAPIFWRARDVMRAASALGLTITETDAVVLLLDNEAEIENAMFDAGMTVIKDRLRPRDGETP